MLQIDYEDDLAIKASGWRYDCARDINDQPFMLKVSFTSPHAANVARHGYYASIEDIDANVAVLMKMLEETGID